MQKFLLNNNFQNLKKNEHSEEKESNSNKVLNLEQFVNKFGFNMKRNKEGSLNEQGRINKEIINKYIKDIIEIILLIHNFEKELNKKIEESSSSAEYKIDEGILINKGWVDNFIKIYVTEEINEYLRISTSKDIIVDIEHIFTNVLKDKIDYWKKIQKANLKLSVDDFTLGDLAQMEKSVDIFYPINFYIY